MHGVPAKHKLQPKAGLQLGNHRLQVRRCALHHSKALQATLNTCQQDNLRNMLDLNLRPGSNLSPKKLLTVHGTSASASSDENLALASTELRRLACSLQFRWCCRMMSRSGPRITLCGLHSI